MNFLEFLDTLQNTLDEIEVRGRKNIDAMSASMNAIEAMKNSIIASFQQEIAKPTETVDGGDEVGRQGDIGTESGREDKPSR